jgi:hypothetical protein
VGIDDPRPDEEALGSSRHVDDAKLLSAARRAAKDEASPVG